MAAFAGDRLVVMDHAQFSTATVLVISEVIVRGVSVGVVQVPLVQVLM